MATLRQPFDEVIKKKTIEWSEELENAFQEIREQFKKGSVLGFFDPKAETFLTMNACKFGLAGVLSQLQKINGSMKEVPIIFISKKFTPAQLKWCVLDQMLYAIVG